MGWVGFVFRYDVNQLTWFGPECWWTGIAVCVHAVGSCATHDRDRGACRTYLDGWTSCSQLASILISLSYQKGSVFTFTSAYYVISSFCLVGRILKGGMPVGRIDEGLICVTNAHMGTWTCRLTSPLHTQSHHLESPWPPRLPLRRSQPSQLSSYCTSGKTKVCRSEVAAQGCFKSVLKSRDGDPGSPHSRTFLYPTWLPEVTMPISLLSCLGRADFL